MSSKDLDGTEVTVSPVDNRCLRSLKRMGAILTPRQTDSCNPFIDKPSLLAGAQVRSVIDTAREHVIVQSAAPAFKLRKQAGSSV